MYLYIYISVYIQKKIDETSISWPSLFIWSITSICSDIYIYSDNNDKHIQS